MDFGKMKTSVRLCEFFPETPSYSVMGWRKWVDYNDDLSLEFCQRAVVEW